MKREGEEVLDAADSVKKAKNEQEPKQKKKNKTIVVPPTLVEFKDWMYKGKPYTITLQYSVHTAPKGLLRECLTVFPHLKRDSRLMCIPTFQKADDDMTDWTPKAAFEKDRLLNSFYEWSKLLCDFIRATGEWADYIDPCSGYPVIGDRGPSIYSEVNGMQSLLKYRLQSVGGCGLITHPKWATRCYPASIFTTAPMNVITNAIIEANQKFLSTAAESQDTPETPETPEDATGKRTV